MILKGDLSKRHEYMVKKAKSTLNSVPERLFIDGNFNKDNWNGGGDVIRQFTNHIEDLYEWRQLYNNIEKTMVVELICEDEEYTANIVVIKHGINIEVGTYSIGWYKHRGKTDKITLNNRLLTEDEYIELLNIIEEVTDFKFSINTWLN